MFIKQISIFLENRNGAVLEVTDALRKAGVNIRALSIADTSDFGVVRLIVDKTEEAVSALRSASIPVTETEVLAVSVGDTPGAFHVALDALFQGGIMIEYSYAFVSPVGGGATVILRCDEQEKAARVLAEKGIKLLGSRDVSF